jgi:hypothetical protein
MEAERFVASQGFVPCEMVAENDGWGKLFLAPVLREPNPCT